MRKKVLALALALALATLGTAGAFAEQPKAEEYRSMMSSGTYYIEYETNHVTKALAVKDGARMDYTVNKKQRGGASFLIPLVGGFLQKTERKPTAMYADRKYYQFQDKKSVVVADEAQLNEENLDPKLAWNSVQLRLALPEELVVFAPADAFNVFTGYKAAQFVESGVEKEMPYDLYSTAHRTKGGDLLFEKLFYFYYNEDGELKKVKTYLKTADGKRTEGMLMKVKKISQEFPKNAFVIPKKYKLYATGMGDMNDLLGRQVEIPRGEEESK